MKHEVRYFSNSGNTKKIADAIAEEIKVRAKSIDEKILESTDILFLGCPVNAFGIDEKVKDFINSLDNVKKVAIFSTSAFAKKIAYKRISKLLKNKSIDYYEDNFYAKGAFQNANQGKPDEEDIKRAKEFAREIVGRN